MHTAMSFYNTLFHFMRESYLTLFVVTLIVDIVILKYIADYLAESMFIADEADKIVDDILDSAINDSYSTNDTT